MKPDTNHLGQYLRALREERGFSNIREYVQHYNLPVGYVYYTEIESGKKYLALETARQLCQALDADSLSFHSQLLKDILPTEVQDDFLNLIPLSKNTDPVEMASKQEALRDAYQRNMLSRINQTANSMTKEAETLFADKRTCAERITAETLQALNYMNESIVPDPTASNCFFGIAGLSKQKQQDLARLIADLRAEFDAYHQQSTEESQVMAIAFSPIKPYMLQSSVD